MYVVFLWCALFACCVGTVTASIKLRRLRKIADGKQGWHTKRAARPWVWVGNGGFIASIGVFVASFPIGDVTLGISALLACMVLIYVFVSGAHEAAGDSEGAN